MCAMTLIDKVKDKRRMHMTDSTENATPPKSTNKKLKFLGTNSNGRAAARRTAPKLPCTIRVGPNEGGGGIWAPNSGRNKLLETGSQIFFPRIDKPLDR